MQGHLRAKHPFLLRRPFLPWPITVTHSGAATALLENRRLRPDRQGSDSVVGRLGPKPGFPIQVRLTLLSPTRPGTSVKGQNLRGDLGVHVRWAFLTVGHGMDIVRGLGFITINY